MTYIDLSFQEATLFENYVSKGYSDYLIALKLADERITQRILATKGEWTKTKLNDIKRAINEEISMAYGGLFESMQEESVTTANLVMGAVLGNEGTRISKSVMNDLLNSKRDIIGYTFKELFNLTEENQARQLRVIVSSGVSQGLPTDEIIRNYNIKSDKLSRGQLKSNIFTVISHSRDAGRHEAYKSLEDDDITRGYEYEATLDGRTSQYCRIHDNNKYYKSIEEIEHLIKVHFNCRSVFIPLPSLNLSSGQRASQFGATKHKNYESWYLSQDDNFHKTTLENKKYNAFLKGKYKVKSLADITKSQDLESIKKSLFD